MSPDLPTQRPGRRHLLRTAPAVAATAVLGGIGTDVSSPWYRSLDKPSWQPPGAVFGPAWTTLYALTAAASARALDRMDDADERRRYAWALGVNLGLNTAWSWLFFTVKRPRLALVEMLLLEASTVDLLRRTGRVDRTGAALLVPYAGWNAFATALTASIVRRNPGR